MSAEILASGKEKWQDLVVTPLLASKEAVIAWLDKVTKASDASQKATTQQEQGSLLQGIVNWWGAAQSVVQGPKQSLGQQVLRTIIFLDFDLKQKTFRFFF